MSAHDVQRMMNAMSIGISIDEAQVLLMTSKDNSDVRGLHMNEFMHLISGNSEEMNVDLSQIKPADAKHHDPEVQQQLLEKMKLEE